MKGRDPRAWVATSSLEARDRHGAAVDLVIQVESPKVGPRRRAAARRARRNTNPRRPFLEGADLPEVPPPTCSSRRWVARRMPRTARSRRRRSRANPLGRARPARIVAICADEEIAVDGAAPARGAGAYPFADPLARPARETCSTWLDGRLPVGRVCGAAGRASSGTARPAVGEGPAGREAACGHETRGTIPEPRALRRPPRGRAAARVGRARRGDGLRGAGRGRRSCLGASHLADRGDHPRSRARLAGSGPFRAPCRSGRARGVGRPYELGEAIGATLGAELVALSRRQGEGRGLQAEHMLDERAATNLLNLPGGEQEGGHRRPFRPTARWSSSAFRDEIGDLAALHSSRRSAGPGPTRPWALALGRAAASVASGSRRRRSGRTTESRSICPERRRAASRGRGTTRTRGDRGARHAGARRHGALRRARLSARTRGRSLLIPAPPAGGRRTPAALAAGG